MPIRLMSSCLLPMLTAMRGSCDNCRRERASKIRNGVEGAVGTVGSIVLFVITKGKRSGGNKV